jgi:hypothetical protein
MGTIEVNIKYILPLCLVLSSCVGGSVESINRVGDPIAIGYSVRDAPNEKRLYLTFRNAAAGPICLGAENWPSNGILLNDGKSVSLTVAGRTMFLRAEQDYCPKCTIKVKPQSESVAYFRYESFDLPANLAQALKELSFRPLGYKCR